MTAKNFSVTRDKQGTYHLQGELTIHDLEALRDFLQKSLKERQESEVVFSFADVGFMDTAALQLLIAFKRWLEPEARLRISALSPEVEDILSLSGLRTALL
jgi:anti-anti-sigma factor